MATLLPKRFRTLPFSIGLLGLVGLTAAATAQGAEPENESRQPSGRVRPDADYARAITNGTRTADGRPGPNSWTDHARYVITAQLLPAEHKVRGSVAMTYHNRSPEPIEELAIHLRQNLHAPGARRNVPVEVTGGMTIDRVQRDGRDALYFVDGTVMLVGLGDGVAPGETTTVTMDFAFTVPAGEAPRMGREGEELYFLGYWYPQFAVRDDVRGLVAEQYLGASEFYMGYADYEVELSVPAGYLVQATGTLQNEGEVLTAKARAALANARSGQRPVAIVDAADLEAGQATQPGTGGRLTWKFLAENVRDFAASVANCYVWDAMPTPVGDRDGDGAVDTCLAQSLYRPEAASWRRSVRHAAHAIQWLSEHVVPYPWPHATVVEGILGGGMEYPMITLCGDQGSPVALQSLIAHELAHMWFPMLVGSNEKAHVWQDEGLADFFTEYLEGSYWRRKATGLRTVGLYRSVVEVSGDAQPLLTHSDFLVDQDDYYYVGYIKPAAALFQLVGLFGEEAVLGAIADYTATWRYRHPQPLDFFRSMERSLGADLSYYWSSWYASNGTLSHAIADVEASADATIVTVEDRGDAILPAVVQATFADGSTAERRIPAATWLAGKRRATVRFRPGVQRVVLHPSRLSLDLDDSDNVWRKR